jgi:hypothetical protein
MKSNLGLVVRSYGSSVRGIFSGLAAFAALGMGTPALATVITFDAAANAHGTPQLSGPITSPYVESGYNISAPGGLYYLGTFDPRYAGEPNLFDSNYDDTTTLTATDGQPFSMLSIDLALMYLGSRPSDEPTTFTGAIAGGGTVTQTFDVTNSSFLTFTLAADFTNLTSVSWTATGGSTPQFSNIDVVASTPLPAALPLFVTGLGAMGLFGWRRKRRAQAVA